MTNACPLTLTELENKLQDKIKLLLHFLNGIDIPNSRKIN